MGDWLLWVHFYGLYRQFAMEIGKMVFGFVMLCILMHFEPLFRTEQRCHFTLCVKGGDGTFTLQKSLSTLPIL